MAEEVIERQEGEDVEFKPRCPTCGSDKVEKISAASKVGRALLVGMFAIGHVSKTFECKNCGYKW